jgi:thioredoxin-related protein|tara:strand:+ start:488 stop:742 length:255 start_codon:yes stop_codon:yes gene_type:complete
MDDLENNIKTSEILLVLFDDETSKYLSYNIPHKLIHISDNEIREFYDIDTVPTISVFKNKNLLANIIGFKSKTELLRSLNNILN